jgi:hypothetical protein
MLDDILEESWTYQEIVKKGMMKGREEERQHFIRGQRETLLGIVRKNFPGLNAFAELQVENIKDTDALQELINRLLFTVQSAEEAKQAIIDASTAETHE